MGQTWVEEFREYGGARLQVMKGGDGPPLLVLHGAGGNPAWMGYHEELARSFTVYAPSHPGFEKSTRPDWIDSIDAVAHFYLGLMEDMGVERYSLLGFSMGGWMAAEMAAMSPHSLDKLVIGAGVGIKPEEGEIAELFTIAREAVAGIRFFDTSQVPNYEETYGQPMTREQAAQERSNRETASRWCWKPYMHNPNLPHYLQRVSTPTLIVWGREDAIVPVECAELYRRAIKGSRVHIIERCGHIPQVEKPQEFLGAVVPFLRGE